MEVLENFKGEDYYMNDVNIYKSLIEKNDLKKLVAIIIGTLDNTIENYQFFVDKDNLLHCSFNLKEPDSIINLNRDGQVFTKFIVQYTQYREQFKKEYTDPKNPIYLETDYTPHRQNHKSGLKIAKFFDVNTNSMNYGEVTDLEFICTDLEAITLIMLDIFRNKSNYQVKIIQSEEKYAWEKGEKDSRIYFTLLRNGKYIDSKNLKELADQFFSLTTIYVDTKSDSGLIAIGNEDYNNLIKEYTLVNLLSDINDRTSKKIPIKRPIGWNEYFMSVALVSSMRSKDPKRRVGAVIVDDDHKVLSIGYNGFPNHCKDSDFPWNDTPKSTESDEDKVEVKDFYVVHAELNAILNYKGETLKGTTIYTTLIPCNECIKAIIQAGIKKIIYRDYKESYKNIASQRMIKAAGIEMISYDSLKENETTVSSKI